MRRNFLNVTITLIIFLSFCKNPSETRLESQERLEGSISAIDFPKGVDWLNTSRPISISELKGKVVILDFWTYCCINCMHVLPELKALEKKWEKELIVVGVHSAKFDTEKGTENIRKAVLRYEIEHPVINDSDFKLWRSYGINAWPSFIIIDPKGKVLGAHSGEGVYELFDEVITKLVKDNPIEMNRNIPDWKKLEKDKTPETVLSFPGKLFVNNDDIIISDSNHNRILRVSAKSGEILDKIGTGKPGLKDGNFREAEFFRPQGVYLKDKLIYVADTENHSIREINLESKTVRTLAGNGKQARTFSQPGFGKLVSLNSPWDLALYKGKLYIAMAGPHQIWSLDLKNNYAEVYAGSGRENIKDGNLLEASLAQPSGITICNGKFYFADSEVSAIRYADLPSGSKVGTIVGKGLFEFGDLDGSPDVAKFQHPLGVTCLNNEIYVADSYNHKIKKINLKNNETVTVGGNGKPGFKDGKNSEFHEPGGIATDGKKIYIADTNQNLVRILEPETGIVTTLYIKPESDPVQTSNSNSDFGGEIVNLGEISLHPGVRFLNLNYTLPKNYKWNEESPFYFKKTSSSDSLKFEGKTEETVLKPGFPRAIPVKLSKGVSDFQIQNILYYCEKEKASLCLIKKLTLKGRINISDSGKKEADLKYNLKQEEFRENLFPEIKGFK